VHASLSIFADHLRDIREKLDGWCVNIRNIINTYKEYRNINRKFI
jgi:hypothetical protein